MGNNPAKCYAVLIPNGSEPAMVDSVWTSREAADKRRPVFEIQVTEEMIRAGVKELNAHLSDAPRVLPDEEIVALIFSAMRDASTSDVAE